MQSNFWNSSIPGMGTQKPANQYGTGTNATYAQNFDNFFGPGVWGNKGMLDAQSQAGATPDAIAQRQGIVNQQHQMNGGGFGGIQNTVPQTPSGGLGMGAGGANVGAGMGGMGGLGGGAMGAPNSFTQNPFYGSMADDITRRVNLSRDQGLNAIRGHAVGVGGLGGSRQGVAEGQAISGAADNLAGQLAGLGGGLYNADQNRDLQRYQGDQNFWSRERGLDYQGIGLGADLMSRGLSTQWQPITNANNIYGQYTGLGTNNTNQQTGGGWMGALGGGLGAAQLWQNLGGWGNK